MKSNIRKLRVEKKNITQMELADVLGVSQQVISRMEKDRDRIQVRNLIAMADYFQVSTDEVLGYQSGKEKEEQEKSQDIDVWKSSGEMLDRRQSAFYELLVSMKRCLEECGI